MARIIYTIALIVMLTFGSTFGVAGGIPVTNDATSGLAYVESSGGLVPPDLEGGNTELELGDVNGDGNPDIVSIGDHYGGVYGEQGIMVWFGDGTGHWSWTHYGEDFGYGGIALGDVNNDSLMDVGYGMHHNYDGPLGDQLLEVALGDGTGQYWTAYDDGLATNGEDWGMFATDFADVDNDGDLDLGSTSFGCCNGEHVYLNQGDGSWVQSWSTTDENGFSNDQFTFGDVNRDGNADLAATYDYGNIYLGDGNGSFSLGQGDLPPGASIVGVALGDVNHDGGDEIGLISSSGAVEVWSWVSPGSWQDISGSLPNSGPYETIQLFDMDMDGNLDVIGFGTGSITVWGGDGNGGWTELVSFNTPAPGYANAFRVSGDADHNGYPDIMLVSAEGSWPSEQNHLRFFKEASTPTELSITPGSPSANQVYHTGAVTFVDWISSVPGDELGTVSLDLSIHGSDGPWQLIASDLPNNGRYQWLIPADLPSTNEAFIRYTLARSDGSVQSISPVAFNILGTVKEPISGLVAANDSPTILGETTILTATVISGTAVLYDWDFGDGTGATGKNIEHVYPAIGMYTATVTATNDISEEQATTIVEIYEEPITGLSVMNNSPTILGETTVLTASVASGSNIVYEWGLGDGTTASGAVVEHVYPSIGNYTANVTATNAVSELQAETQVEVFEEPIAGLTAVNDSPTILGETTTLTASVLSGSNVVYEWDLGDGITLTGAIVSHIYPDPGIYTATLTAHNAVSQFQLTTKVEIVNLKIIQYFWMPILWRGDG